MTNERMFFGALVNAYSSPVMEAKISLNAIKTYLDRSTVSLQRRDLGGALLTIRFGSRHSGARRVGSRPSLHKYPRNHHTGSSGRTLSMPQSRLDWVTCLVDVVLDDGCPDHGCSTGSKAPGNLLQGGEFPTSLCECRVYLRRDDQIIPQPWF